MQDGMGYDRRDFLKTLALGIAGSVPLLNILSGCSDSDLDPELRKYLRAEDASSTPEGKMSELEVQVEERFSALRTSGKVEPFVRTRWIATDLNEDISGNGIKGNKILSINQDNSIHLASMVKPLVAADYLQRVENEGFEIDEFVYEDLRSIISGKNRNGKKARLRNNNTKTSILMDILGGPEEVQRSLRGAYPGVFDNTEIMEPIYYDGTSYGNRTTPHDLNRFLFLLHHGQIIGHEKIKEYMIEPNADRIIDKVDNIPVQTRLMHKTGSDGYMIGDMGIVRAIGKDGKFYPYTFVGIVHTARDPENEDRDHKYAGLGSQYLWQEKANELIREVSAITYNHMKEKYDLI